METLAEAFKAHFIPGSTTLLILGLAAGLLAMRAYRRWALRWLVALTGFYWLISTPLFARSFERLLSAGRTTLEDVPQAEAIVILGGGSETYQAEAGGLSTMSDATSLRVLEGARLARSLPQAQLIVSGGSEDRIPEAEAMMDALVQLGMEEDRISTESLSGNTYEQAQMLKPLLEARRFLLVTSPTHMTRALATFRNQGLDPLPAPALQHSSSEGAKPFPLLPNSGALSASRMAFRELFALGYYWWMGWLSPAGQAP